jgi:uncharacterized protein YtpQ (UPF0354 family)
VSLTGAAVAYLKADLRGDSEPADFQFSSKDDEPVLRNLHNGLLVAYLVDRGDDFQYVSHRNLKTEGISEEALHKNAVANLAKLAQRKLRVTDQDGYYAVFLDGNFEASLVLVDQLWDRGMARLVSSEFLACVPARDILAFCDSGSPSGVEKLRNVINRVWPDGHHLLTRSLYRRRHSRWERVLD